MNSDILIGLQAAFGMFLAVYAHEAGGQSWITAVSAAYTLFAVLTFFERRR